MRAGQRGHLGEAQLQPKRVVTQPWNVSSSHCAVGCSCCSVVYKLSLQTGAGAPDEYRVRCSAGLGLEAKNIVFGVDDMPENRRRWYELVSGGSYRCRCCHG